MTDDVPDWVKRRQLDAVNALAFTPAKPKLAKANALDLDSIANEFAEDFGYLTECRELPGDVFELEFIHAKERKIYTIMLYEHRGEWLCNSVKSEPITR